MEFLDLDASVSNEDSGSLFTEYSLRSRLEEVLKRPYRCSVAASRVPKSPYVEQGLRLVKFVTETS